MTTQEIVEALLKLEHKKEAVLRHVYQIEGDSHGYLDEKLQIAYRSGLLGWYCDLDLGNRQRFIELAEAEASK